LLGGREATGEIAVAEAGLDDGFIDDITFPAADGYLLGASLFLPRGAKRQAALLNSAAAVPRQIYRGFAGYLARRGCAVPTYDYRGTGDSRQKSLVGFNASMSDWAALDVTAAVAWMRERYKTLPLNYVGQAGNPDHHPRRRRRDQVRPSRLLSPEHRDTLWRGAAEWMEAAE
jgi:fermentation-respiration switch protein FrsA (DUF1100 family)